MLYRKYLIKRGNSFLISKLNLQSLAELPTFSSGTLVIWFNLQQYKKVKILIFILLNVLTNSGVYIAKKKTKYFFYIKVNFSFIFNLINIYLSNVDININSLSLNKGENNLEILLLYNKIPIIPELDNFFEQVMNLLVYLEEKSFSLKLNIHTISLIGGETFLRILKLPLFLSK